jgi:hypothetical protein
LNKILSLYKKIDEQNDFVRASIYILGGFSLVLVGYGIGRYVIGMVAF